MTKLRGWAMICKFALILSAKATANANAKIQALQTPASNLCICKSALRRMKPSEAASLFDLLMCFSQVRQSRRDCISCCCWWLPAGWLLADTAGWYNMILQQQRHSKSVWNAAVFPPRAVREHQQCRASERTVTATEGCRTLRSDSLSLPNTANGWDSVEVTLVHREFKRFCKTQLSGFCACNSGKEHCFFYEVLQIKVVISDKLINCVVISHQLILIPISVIFQAKNVKTFFGSSFLNVRMCCFSLSIMTVDE